MERGECNHWNMIDCHHERSERFGLTKPPVIALRQEPRSLASLMMTMLPETIRSAT